MEWTGVYFDCTLAEWHEWTGDLGEPDPAAIPSFTIDVDAFREAVRQRILVQDWCEKHIGCRLPVTALKDCHMSTLLDDRAVQVEPNTGAIVEDLFTLSR